MQELAHEILRALCDHPEVTTKQEFQRLANSIYRKYKTRETLPAHVLVYAYQDGLAQGIYPRDRRVFKLLRKRAVRSLSGVSVISLLTKFWGCPGKCVFCPTFENLPKSYVPNEPAVMRAELNDFDPVRQIQNRLRSLESTWHSIAKCDVRVIGGTWSVYPKEYQEAVMRGIYDGHSTYSVARTHIEAGEEGDRLAGFRIKKGYEMIASKSLEEAQIRNESADSRVIGIAIETRPDWITPEEINLLRKYGVTRVEIGYQTTHDHINELNKRGHGNEASIQATKLLKDAGFKVVAHMMPNLLGSTPELDRTSMREIFTNQAFCPDELKIYPMVVTAKSELTKIWEDGGFTPYDDETLMNLMVDLETYLPEWVRLNRSYRDIPATEILAGSKLSNLRELTNKIMEKRGLKRRDISAREIRAKENKPACAELVIEKYPASDGMEHFLQFIDPTDRTLFGLLRLRIPSSYFTGLPHNIELLQNAAIIREVHVFGDQLPIGAEPDWSGQHMGFWKKLMAEAERIIWTDYPNISKIAVIAGAGVRPYYKMLGYALVDSYMVKELR